MCGKIEQHLLDIKTSIILMMYQAKRFTEFPDVKSRIESLLSETNQEILQQEELLNCGSRRELTEKDISVEKTTTGPLDEEFSSVEVFETECNKQEQTRLLRHCLRSQVSQKIRESKAAPKMRPVEPKSKKTD